MESLPRALARAALRFAARNAAVPFSLRPADVRAAAPTLRQVPRILDGAPGVRAAVRAVADANRTAATADPSTSSSLLDASIAAVADLHTSIAFIVASARAARAAHASPPPTLPVIGSVGIHRVFGYRFVVTGWDATCARGPEWAASVGGDPDAPWLTALPDEGDCVALFGAPRASKYIAAANYHAAPPAARVTHRALRHFFDGWSRSLSRYVPCARLRYEYPGDAELVPDDTEAIDGDAGVLFAGEEGVVRRVRGVE